MNEKAKTLLEQGDAFLSCLNNVMHTEKVAHGVTLTVVVVEAVETTLEVTVEVLR